MIRAFVDWLEHRTSLRRFLDAMLLEHIPGGAKWRYVWGSTLSFVFMLQVVTGILLMTAYSPSKSTAWESVYYIQYQMDFGWLIRGLHHFGSQTMVVLIGLHMLQVVIAGAHLPPREVNWWLGLGLMGLVLGMSLTGYLLPWDQKGYWATRVATNIAGSVPILGQYIQRQAVGGIEYGHSTVTRFFGLHVAILPPLIVILMVAHITLFRRHGVTAPKHAKGDGWFWPDQAFRDLVICLIIFGIMLFLVIRGHSLFSSNHEAETTTAAAASAEDVSWYEYWVHGGRYGMGVNLDAPADRATNYEPRPEWYFLFLFQILKYFEGDYMIVGTVLIPTAIGVILFILPLLGFGQMRPLGHIIGVVFVTALLTGAATLTCLALADDTPSAVPHAMLTRLGLVVAPTIAGGLLLFLAILAVLPPGGFRAFVSFLSSAVMTVLVVCAGLLLYAALSNQVPGQVDEFMQQQMAEYEKATPESREEFEAALEKAEEYRKHVAINVEEANRAIEVAKEGIPAEGAIFLLRRDPKTQFRPLFLKNCASCHSYGEFTDAAFKTTEQKGFENAKFTASDLAGFGKKEWIHSFLLNPASKRFYGRSRTKDDMPNFYTMSDWVKGRFDSAKEDNGEKGVKKVKEDFSKIAAWLATHPTGTKWDKGPHAEAYKLFKEEYRCIRCHKYEDIGRTRAPDLTDYGSKEWLIGMLHAPDGPRMYGENNKMPNLRNMQSPTWPMDKEAYEAFLKKERGLEEEGKLNIKYADLSDMHRELIVRYLAGDYRVVFGGQPISGPPKKEE